MEVPLNFLIGMPLTIRESLFHGILWYSDSGRVRCIRPCMATESEASLS